MTPYTGRLLRPIAIDEAERALRLFFSGKEATSPTTFVPVSRDAEALRSGARACQVRKLLLGPRAGPLYQSNDFRPG
jgi:hypothetical protein